MDNVRTSRFGDVTRLFRVAAAVSTAARSVAAAREESAVSSIDLGEGLADSAGSVPASADGSADDESRIVGRRIRRLRHARGLTLVQLAAAAGLSHPFLSQLERGLARPSMQSLHRIAQALGSSQIELLAVGADSTGAADSAGPVVVLQSGDGTRGEYGRGSARMLTSGDRPFQPMEIRGYNFDLGEVYVHAEDEFVYVVGGTVQVELDRGTMHELRVGDSLYFEGGTPHRWGAIDDGGYHLIVVKQRAETSE